MRVLIYLVNILLTDIENLAPNVLSVREHTLELYHERTLSFLLALLSKVIFSVKLSGVYIGREELESGSYYLELGYTRRLTFSLLYALR